MKNLLHILGYTKEFDNGGEYDMVIYNSRSNSCRLYEIKHSGRVNDNQTGYLRDDTGLALVRHRFGPIDERCVIYRGAAQIIEGIKYVNAEEYLISLKR